MTGAEVNLSQFFITGGALSPDSPSYVKRSVDDELFDLALAGEFCYGLTARQMGKSSLMYHTARRLQTQGVSPVIIDLTTIGSDEVSPEQWYLGLLRHLKDQLILAIALEAWWQARGSLSIVQRFITFLHDVVLEEIKGPVVIFVDEIDTTLSLNFSDDFFAAIRAIYNARAADPIYQRLTFVLFGVATPGDLIKDRSRTPFNIGHRLDLAEFNRQEARVLEHGLQTHYPDQSQAIFDRIFYWTAGHPYLTQKLCRLAVEDKNKVWADKQIDQLVERLFLSEEARTETNLQFVRDNILASPRRRQLLDLYHQVHTGKVVPEDERSIEQNRLKLLGLVRVEQGVLKVRNEIYRQAFNLEWIKANTPKDRIRQTIIISLGLIILLALGIGFIIYRQQQQTVEARAATAVEDFRLPSADVRLNSLAELFGLPGYEAEARRLFYEELSSIDQQAMFNLADPQGVEKQLIIVIKGLYTDPRITEQGDQILAAMTRPLSSLQDVNDHKAKNLTIEIESWLQGRKHHVQQEYQQAIIAYDAAISLNGENPGTYFDQARAYTAFNEPELALADLATVLSLNEEAWQEHVRQLVIDDEQLYTTAWRDRGKYQVIAALVPTPTDTPIFTVMPSPTLSKATPIPKTSTPTPIPVLPALAGTPPPQPVAAISPDNANQVAQLARWRKGAIQKVAYSPDGTLLAVASSIDIDFYDAQTLTYLRSIKTDAWVTSLTFSSDGAILASGSRDKIITLWRVSDGMPLHTLKGHTNKVNSVAFSPDGVMLASGSEDSTVRLWQANSGKLIRTLKGHTESVNSVAFSPDGTTLASGSGNTLESDIEDNTVRLWHVADGSLLHILEGHTEWVSSVIFSPDGTTLASGSGDATIRMWDVSTGLQLRVLKGHTGSVKSVTFSPDGATLASGSYDTTIRLWKVADGTLLDTLAGHTWSVESIVFSPDGKRLASGSDDTTVRLWQVSDRTPLLTQSGYASEVAGVAFSPDGNMLALGTWGNFVELWSVSEGKNLRTLSGHENNVNSVAFSPDGEILASGSVDNTIRLWRTSDGALLRTLAQHTGNVLSVAFSPDGVLLASGSGDTTVRLWRVADGTLLHTLEGHTALVWSVAFSSDGMTLVSGSVDRTVRLWRVADGAPLRILTGHTGIVTSVAFSPDGTTLASGSYDTTIRLWQAPDGKLLHTLTGHSSNINSIAFSPDGTILVSGAGDNTLRLWRASDGTLLTTLKGHTGLVWSVAFSPDGAMLASGSGDTTVRLWGVIGDTKNDER